MATHSWVLGKWSWLGRRSGKIKRTKETKVIDWNGFVEVKKGGSDPYLKNTCFKRGETRHWDWWWRIQGNCWNDGGTHGGLYLRHCQYQWGKYVNFYFFIHRKHLKDHQTWKSNFLTEKKKHRKKVAWLDFINN
jgi:hypothetical protein